MKKVLLGILALTVIAVFGLTIMIANKDGTSGSSASFSGSSSTISVGGKTIKVFGGSNRSISATDDGQKIVVDGNTIVVSNGKVTINGKTQELGEFSTLQIMVTDNGEVKVQKE